MMAENSISFLMLQRALTIVTIKKPSEKTIQRRLYPLCMYVGSWLQTKC